ncbi:MAG: hypothetical protein AAF638_07510 [Pseudomonadota bacterium]
MRNILFPTAILWLFILPAFGGEADVTDVRISAEAGGTYRFDVTVAHADTGWDHYADVWVVETPDGVELGRRVLHHPHVNEQPFTRSLGGVAIPDGMDTVVIKAGDSVHGFGGVEVRVDVPR